MAESHPLFFWVSSAGPSRDLSVTLPPLEACSSLPLLRNEAGGIGLLGSGGEGRDACEPGCTLRPGSSGKRASRGPVVDCLSWAHPRQCRLSLAAESRDYSLVVMPRLLIVVVSVMEHRL